MESLDAARNNCVVNVENIGEKRLGGNLSLVQFFNFLLHQNTLSCYFLSRSRHSQYPGDPLEKYHANPVRHCVSLLVPVMIVEDQDSGHHACCHHEHYCIEVGSDQRTV